MLLYPRHRWDQLTAASPLQRQYTTASNEIDMGKVQAEVDRMVAASAPPAALKVSAVAKGDRAGRTCWLELVRLLTIALALVWLFSPPHDDGAAKRPGGQPQFDGAVERSCGSSAIAQLIHRRQQQSLSTAADSPLRLGDLEAALSWTESCLADRGAAATTTDGAGLPLSSVYHIAAAAAPTRGDSQGAVCSSLQIAVDEAKRAADKASAATETVAGQVESLQELLGPAIGSLDGEQRKLRQELAALQTEPAAAAGPALPPVSLSR